MLWKIILVFALVDSALQSPCPCNKSHDQSRYCYGNFAFRCKVLSRGPAANGNKNELDYTTVINEIYRKGTNAADEIMAGNNINIRTGATSNLCGVTFSIGKEYFVSGYLNYAGIVFVDNCFWVEPFSNLNAQQVNLFNKQTGYDCYCRVKEYWNNPSGWLQTKFCMKACKAKYASCRRDTSSGKCRWDVGGSTPTGC